MAELKPCPFCGGHANVRNTAYNLIGRSYVVCMGCGASTHSFDVSYLYSSEEKAIEAWNRRTHEE